MVTFFRNLSPMSSPFSLVFRERRSYAQLTRLLKPAEGSLRAEAFVEDILRDHVRRIIEELLSVEAVNPARVKVLKGELRKWLSYGKRIYLIPQNEAWDGLFKEVHAKMRRRGTAVA